MITRKPQLNSNTSDASREGLLKLLTIDLYQHSSQVNLQVLVTPSAAHRSLVLLVLTHLQSLETILPLQLNLNLFKPSSQLSHVLHVFGHMVDTP